MNRRQAAIYEMVRGRWPLMIMLMFVMLPFGAGPQGAAEGSTLRQLVLSGVFLAAAFTIARFPERWHLLREGLPLSLLVLVIYVALSAAWSPEPYVSFKRVVQVVGVVVVALAVLVGGNGRQPVYRLVSPVLWVGMLLALSVIAVYPEYAFSDIGLRAFMATKNNFGQFAVLCVVFPIAMLRLDQGRKWVWWPLLLLGLAGLILSRSATATATLVAALLVVGLVWANRNMHSSWKQVLLVFGLALVACVFAAIVLMGLPSAADLSRAMVALTGRDVTLTGRTYLWELMLNEWSKHPYFGSGYGGFWLGLEGASGQVAYLVKWGYPGQAHNSFIDLLNELGVVGFCLVLWFLGEHVLNLARLIRKERDAGWFHLTLLLLLLVMSVAEAVVLKAANPWWIVFVMSVVEVRYRTRRRVQITAHRPSVGAAATPVGGD